MPSLSHYHIIIFDKKSKKGFKTKEGIKAFKDNDANDIYTVFKKQSNHLIGKNEAKILEESLNDAILMNRVEYDQMVQNFLTEIDNIDFQKLMKFEGLITSINGKLTINQEVFNQNYQQIRNLTRQIFPNPGKIRRNSEYILKQLTIYINKYRKQIFEYMMTAILKDSEEILGDLADNKIDELLTKHFSNNLKAGIKIENRKKSKKISNKNNENIKISIRANGLGNDGRGYDTVQIKNSNRNTAINLQLPNDQMFTAALKEASGSMYNKVSLVSKSKVTSLVNDWPIPAPKKNLAINGLSARDLNISQFKTMKKIFFIQAIMGLNNLDVNSDFLIVNTGLVNKPIRVISLYDIIFNDAGHILKISESSNATLRNIPDNSIEPIPQVPRSTSTFREFVTGATLSLKTQISLSQILNKYSS